MNRHFDSTFYQKLGLGLICLVISVLYITTFSWIPTSDGFTWIKAVDRDAWETIFLPTHLLSLFLVSIIKKIFLSFGVFFHTVYAIQALNVLSAITAIYFLDRLAREIGLTARLALVSAFWLGISFDLWYFANGEIHHSALAAIICLFYFLVRYDKNPSIKLAFVTALLYALSGALHQEHFLIGLTALYFYFARGFEKNRLYHFLVFITISMVATLLVFGIVAVIVYEIHNLGDFLRWFFLMHNINVGSGHTYFAQQDWHLVRWIKGWLMSLIYGSQIIVDYLRYHFVRSAPHMTFVFAVTCVASTMIGFLFLRGICSVSKLAHSNRRYLIGLLIWLFSYKFLFNLTFTPETPEYHIGTLPPFILLMIFGVASLKSSQVRNVLLTSLVGFTLWNNLFFGVIPFKVHGDNMRNFKEFADKNFITNDFFFSTESCLDAIVRKRWAFFSLKSLSEVKNKEKAFQDIYDEIVNKIQAGRRVYVYDFVPSQYALRGMNFANKHITFTQQDFEEKLEEFKKRLNFTPVFEYWEANKSEYYLVNQKKDWLWQVSFKTL